MNLKTDYQKLYQHWLEEFEKSELSPLTQENFDYYRKTVDYIANFELEGKQNIEVQLVKTYKDGFEYLFNDLLKMREVKLLNTALVLQEIDYNNVIEAEKLFYQNLVSVIKGFKKLKTLTLYDDKELIKIDEVFEEEEVSAGRSPAKTPVEKHIENVNVDIPQEEPEIKQPQQDAQYKYTLIRFNNSSPPLVGIDGINYGPFQENDIANMPQQNAKILMYEKIAEEIDVS